MRTFQFALAAMMLVISASSVWADPCPSTGYARFCNEIIQINPDGSVSIYTSSPNPSGLSISTEPYDGSEDQLIGVVDLYQGFTVTSLNLTGTSTMGVFRFDGDGANTGGTLPTPGCLDVIQPNLTFYGCNGATNSADTSGYMGFTSNGGNVSYTIPDVANLNAGIVSFGAGLQAGDTAWFSLEGAPVTSGLAATANVANTDPPPDGVPEPNSMWGVLAFGFIAALIGRLGNRSGFLAGDGPR